MNIRKIKIISLVLVFCLMMPMFSYASGGVVLDIKATDDASGVDKIILPDGQEIKGDFSKYTITENGDYIFIAWDVAGNKNETKYSITEIDEDYPSIIINDYDTAWRNEDLEVSAEVERGTLEVSSHIFVENSSYTFVAVNKDGVNRVERTVTIENIDKEKPQFNLGYKNNVISISKVVDSDSGVRGIILPNGDKIDGPSAEYAINKGGAYVFKALDIAGNEAKKTAFIIGDEFIEIPDIDDSSDLGEIGDIIDDVQDKIDDMEDGDIKDDLQDKLDGIKEEYDDEIKRRIDKIDSDIDNMESVNKAHGIQEDINNLPDYKTDKYKPIAKDEQIRLSDKLSGKIKSILEAIALADAIEAVEKAEDTFKQGDVLTGRDKVSKLPNGEDKDNLTERLDEVQRIIDLIREIDSDIDNLDSLDKVDEIQDKIDSLPSGEDKNRLQDKLKDKIKELDKDKEYDDLIQEIEEDIKNLDDLDKVGDIQDKIDLLPDGPDKDRLQDALDDKIKEIEDLENEYKDILKDAVDAVEKAEDSKKQDDIDDARDKVDKLPDGDIKDGLNDRLDKIEDEIKDKISEIEDDINNIKRPIDKDQIGDIQDKIDSLPDGEDKDRLQDALDDKVKEIEDNDELDNIIGGIEDDIDSITRPIDKDLVDDIQDKIDSLPDGGEKDRLQDELDDKIKDLEDLDDLIKEIEDDIESITKPIDKDFIDEIQDKIDSLPECDDKDRLQDDLDNKIKDLEESDNIIKDIEDYIKNLDDLDKVGDIQDKIDKLPDGRDKDRLQDALNDKIKDLEDLNDKIKGIEDDINSITRPIDQEFVDEIQDKINSLPDGPEKDRLQDKLNDKIKELEEEFNKLLEDAIKSVEKAEKTYKQKDIDKARDKVNLLPEGKDKTDLKLRLDRLQKQIDIIVDIDKDIDDIKDPDNTEEVKEIQDKIDKLPDSKDKKKLEKRLAQTGSNMNALIIVGVVTVLTGLVLVLRKKRLEN